MNVQRILIVLALLGCLIAAVGAGFQWRSKRPGRSGARELRAEAPPAATVRGGGAVMSGPQAERQPSPAGSGLDRQPPEPATQEQQTALKMGGFLDSNQVNEALGLARQLSKSKDADTRVKTVAVLGRIGLKALPELSDLVSDTDGGVRRQACQQWKTIVSGIPDDAKKSRIVLAGMSVLNDQESLNGLAAVLADLPKPLAVRSWVSLVQAANPYAAEVARTRYQLMTGEPYSTPQAAEKWIKENSPAGEPSRSQTRPK